MRFGQQAEEAAALYLEKHGYKILQRNYRTRLAEIDIIALHKALSSTDTNLNAINSQDNQTVDTLVFIEVKARSSTRYGLPSEAVSISKQKKIVSAALQYIKEHGFNDTKIRFDVMSILVDNGQYKIEIIDNAFQGC
ncbi:MAG: YraN family protein [Desulfamplus sp.]|nr:YraN family protein [Desulfamplus sp.]MBF0390297.1 YraN family protein [Desulfamplus sp.]